MARYRFPNGPHLLRMVQPIRSPENPGTTVVSIGLLIPWPENPGYRTRVWINMSNAALQKYLAPEALSHKIYGMGNICFNGINTFVAVC